VYFCQILIKTIKMKTYNLSESINPKIKKVSKSEIIIDLSKGYCDHCEEPKTDINSSYCCKGCEDAEIKFNQLDN